MASLIGKDKELNQPPLGNYRAKLPYAFVLNQGNQAVTTSAGSQAGADYEPSLVVLDQLDSYTVDEPVAVVITPTQDGGKHITNRGMVLKDISLSGTTGFMRDGGSAAIRSQVTAQPGTGGNAAPPATANGSHETQRQNNSGFLRFVQLRNLFRKYAHIKRSGSPDEAAATTLSFYDAKLGEWWIVEPMQFKMSRSSKKPFSYDYSIQVRAVAPATTQSPRIAALPGDKETRSERGEMKRVVERLDGNSAAIREFAGTRSGVARDAFNQVLPPLDAVTAQFDDSNFSAETLRSIPVGLERRLANSLDGMMMQLSNLGGDPALIAAANDLYIETRQLSEALFARANSLLDTVADSSPAAILRAENAKYTEQRAPFGGAGPQLNDPGGTTSLPSAPFVAGGGFANLSNIDFSIYDTVKSVLVFDGETLYDFARRTTGDAHTAPLIIALNKLQFPYFVPRGTAVTVGTIPAGQPVLVPASSSATAAAVDLPLAAPLAPSFFGSVTSSDATRTVVSDANAVGWRDHQWCGFTFTVGTSTGSTQTAIIVDNIGQSLTLDHALLPLASSPQYSIALVQQQKQQATTAIERRYGVDLRVVFRPSGSQQPPLADLFVPPHGDLAVVAGLANLEQALTVLFLTEQGRNVANPEYGLALPIGEANSQERAIAFDLAARRALLADPRIESIARLELAANGDVTSLVATVVPVGSAEQVLTLPTTL
jgi:hypothetical protein